MEILYPRAGFRLVFICVQDDLPSGQSAEDIMLDLILVVAGLGFFGLALGLASVCDRS
jgi:hypothetical protein